MRGSLHFLEVWRKPFLCNTAATILNIMHQYTLRVQYVFPAPVFNGALNDTAVPARSPFLFAHKPHTVDHDRIVMPAGWDS
ncbi:hypothetical protein EI94DRAFT_178222 [Lactarius quietus]|nr:hypothetical protein EI94DRAFT_178222 [Lactarius quietus]